MKRFLLLLSTCIAALAQPVTDQMLANPDPADWLMWRRTLNSWGYSPLNQITKDNVNKLKMVWSRGMGPGIQEATPLVHNGVMYLPNPSDYPGDGRRYGRDEVGVQAQLAGRLQ